MTPSAWSKHTAHAHCWALVVLWPGHAGMRDKSCERREPPGPCATRAVRGGNLPPPPRPGGPPREPHERPARRRGTVVPVTDGCELCDMPCSLDARPPSPFIMTLETRAHERGGAHAGAGRAWAAASTLQNRAPGFIRKVMPRLPCLIAIAYR